MFCYIIKFLGNYKGSIEQSNFFFEYIIRFDNLLLLYFDKRKFEYDTANLLIKFKLLLKKKKRSYKIN